MLDLRGNKARRVLLLTFALLILLPGILTHAQSPPPPAEDRFQWIEGLDDLYPREHGPHLSRPLPSQALKAAPDHAAPRGEAPADYPTSKELIQSLRQLHAAHPRLVQVSRAGTSWQGQHIMAVRMGNEAAGNLDQRPALYVDGQHHAREAVSAQTVLHFLWYLASQYGSDPLVTRLLDTRTVYAIPSVNPDGNDIFLASDQRQRKTANPSASDDDGDSLFDEDGREDAGYGTYDVFHYAFDEVWAAAYPEYPFVGGPEVWGSHMLWYGFVGIYDGAGRESAQTDDDEDGKTGEDPPGGVDPNRNYDSHWESGNNHPPSAIYHGPVPFSEPETGVVRDFVLARPNIVTASSYHSGSDVLLHPWGWSKDAELPDVYWYEMLSRKGSQLTEVYGFQGTRHCWTARGFYPGSGSTMDWLYEQGILAWSPEVYGASSVAYVEPIPDTSTYAVGMSTGEAFNPQPAEITLTADRWLGWNLYLLAATPNVGLSSAQVKDGNLEITVANDGLLPLDVEVVVKVGREIHGTAMAGLSAGEQAWSLPLPSRRRTQKVTLTLTARSVVGTAAGPTQVEVVTLQVKEEQVRVLQGRLEPFVQLGGTFGGWFADPAVWDTPEYHLGPPLIVEEGSE